MWQFERIWRSKKTEESHQDFKRQSQKLNQLINATKEEYYAIHGGGPVSCLRYLLLVFCYFDSSLLAVCIVWCSVDLMVVGLIQEEHVAC